MTWMMRSRLLLQFWSVLAIALAACSVSPPVPGLSMAAQHSLAEAMTEEGNDNAALHLLRASAQRTPDDALAQERYGLAAERARLYSEALAALDRAVQVGGPIPARLVEQGRIALEAGDMPAAVQAYTRALEREPANISALNGLGVAEDLQRRHAEAQAHYREALRLAPNDWGIRNNLALSLLMSGRAGQACEVLADAATDPAAPRQARHNLGLALVAAGKREDAIRVLRIDTPAPEAAAMADEFATFARWLASPEATTPLRP
ncbi:MAG: tetratricopeptide repeat protein [Rhodopila sp.]